MIRALTLTELGEAAREDLAAALKEASQTGEKSPLLYALPCSRNGGTNIA